MDDLCLLERHIGPPLREGFIQYYGVDDKQADEMVQTYRKYYRTLGLPGSKPYEGLEKALSKLKEAGYQLIVATSKPENVSKQFLKHYELSGYFVDICGSDMEAGRNTKEEVLRYALAKNNICNLDQATMVGDRFHDVEGAKAVGIPCVGVLYGFGSKEELLTAGAIHVVKDTEELAAYFLDK